MTPSQFHPNFGVFPLDQIADVGVSVSRYLWRTDRHMDRQTDRRNLSFIAKYSALQWRRAVKTVAEIANISHRPRLVAYREGIWRRIGWAKRLSRDGIFNNHSFYYHSLYCKFIALVCHCIEFWKKANIWWSYDKSWWLNFQLSCTQCDYGTVSVSVRLWDMKGFYYVQIYLFHASLNGVEYL